MHTVSKIKRKDDGPQIKGVAFYPIYLSSGCPSIGCTIAAGEGGVLTEWDGAPVGTTVGNFDPGQKPLTDAPELTRLVLESLRGIPVTDQKKIDSQLASLLIDVAPEEQAVNYAVAASLAVARCGALYDRMPLWRYIAEKMRNHPYSEPNIPSLLCNTLGGGGHHSNDMNITELMCLLPLSPSEALQLQKKISDHIKSTFKERKIEYGLGLEACTVPQHIDDNAALYMLTEALNAEGAALRGVTIGLDCAGRVRKKDVIELCKSYPLISYVEDPWHKDGEVWDDVCLDGKTVAADDWVAGDLSRLKALPGVTAVVLKLNHFGTLSRIVEAVDYCKRRGIKTIASQRSQETGRKILAHLAMGADFDILKAGSLERERITFYNEILATAAMFQPQ